MDLLDSRKKLSLQLELCAMTALEQTVIMHPGRKRKLVVVVLPPLNDCMVVKRAAGVGALAPVLTPGWVFSVFRLARVAMAWRTDSVEATFGAMGKMNQSLGEDLGGLSLKKLKRRLTHGVELDEVYKTASSSMKTACVALVPPDPNWKIDLDQERGGVAALENMDLRQMKRK